MDYETLIIIYIFSGIIGGIISGLITGGIASAIGNSKGYEGPAFTLGFFLGILGIIIVACIHVEDKNSGNSQTVVGWVCPHCYTANAPDAQFCKGCGTKKPVPKPVQQNNTKPLKKIVGVFTDGNVKILIDNDSFIISSNSLGTRQGKVTYHDNNKINLTVNGTNKETTLTLVNDNMLVSSGGKVYKKCQNDIVECQMCQKKALLSYHVKIVDPVGIIRYRIVCPECLQKYNCTILSEHQSGE